MGIFNLQMKILKVMLYFPWQWTEDCTRVSTDGGNSQKAFRTMSKGNFSDARGTLSSVKADHKNNSSAISKKKSSSNFLLLLRNNKT